jgi:hypothetical protein
MIDNRQAMYDGFSDKGVHYVEWFQIAKDFLKLAFASDHNEVKCPYNRCQNREMLSEYQMFGHIAKQEFIAELYGVAPTWRGAATHN